MSSILSKTHMHCKRDIKNRPTAGQDKNSNGLTSERTFSENPYPRALCSGLPSPARKATRRNPECEQRAKERIMCGRHFVLAVFVQVKYDVLSERGTTRSLVFMEEECIMSPNSRHYINLLLLQYITNIRNLT